MEQYIGIIWKYQKYGTEYGDNLEISGTYGTVYWDNLEISGTYGTVYWDNLEISGTYMEQYMGIIWKYQEHIWNSTWG